MNRLTVWLALLIFSSAALSADMDTARKRMAAINLGPAIVLPLPDGSIDFSDRLQLLEGFRGPDTGGGGLFIVPDVKGLTRDEAVAAIVEAGYTVQQTDIAAYCVTPGTVFVQTPPAGTTGGLNVRIYVISGPPDSRVVRCAKAPPAGSR